MLGKIDRHGRNGRVLSNAPIATPRRERDRPGSSGQDMQPLDCCRRMSGPRSLIASVMVKPNYGRSLAGTDLGTHLRRARARPRDGWPVVALPAHARAMLTKAFIAAEGLRRPG